MPNGEAEQSTRSRPTTIAPHPLQTGKCISMDLMIALSMTNNGDDTIITIVGRFSKMCHFIPTTSNLDAPSLASLILSHILMLHGLPKSIVSDRDPWFTGAFWKTLNEHLSTNLPFSTAYHPQTKGHQGFLPHHVYPSTHSPDEDS